MKPNSTQDSVTTFCFRIAIYSLVVYYSFGISFIMSRYDTMLKVKVYRSKLGLICSTVSPLLLDISFSTVWIGNYCFAWQINLVRWNEPYQKLATCDSSGIIFVWIRYEGRWSIELINDRNTPVS